MYNPAFCGVKRFFDYRMFYRNQWTGFDGAPKTYGASLHMKFFKGKLGAGGYYFRDEIGPFQNNTGALTLAYHIKFDDVVFSAGLQGNYTSQNFIGTKVTLHNSVDNTINRYSTGDKAQTFDGSFGILLINDRFHAGLAMLNMMGKEIRHYKNDPQFKAKYQNQLAYSITVGYNYAEDENYTFENSIMALYTSGVPFYLDYTLRVHFHKMIFAGVSIRIQDAAALHLGVTLKEQFQIAYSYDIVTSPLSKYQSGSHELKLVFSSNLGTDQKRKGLNKQFLKQKFQFLL
jgi:type IX secretion system PorP/SprF family membrane protein